MENATRKNILKYVKDTYSVDPDYPWEDSKNFAVLRHTDNKKWFGLIMDINPEKLGLKDYKSDEIIDVINLKCDPLMIGSLVKDNGIFPAYHMNKNYWITVLLDGSLLMGKACALLDMSFELTAKKIKKRKKTDS